MINAARAMYATVANTHVSPVRDRNDFVCRKTYYKLS
jgi:hypothetical protein